MGTTNLQQNYNQLFKMLGLEHKEDREKYVFGATTLEETDHNHFETTYVVIKPDDEEMDKERA